MRALRSRDIAMCLCAVAGFAASENALAQGAAASQGTRPTRIDDLPARSDLAQRLGPPGGPAFRAAVEDVKRRIAAGTMDPRLSPFDASVMGLDLFVDDGAIAPAPDVPATVRASSSARGVGAAPDFAYFDGFETYQVWTTPQTHPIPSTLRLTGQLEPGGFSAISSSMFAVTALPQPAYADGDWTYSPAAPVGPNPYNPGGVGGYPADRDPAVEQALMNGTGSRVHALGDGGRLTSYFLGYRVHEDRLYVPEAASDIVPGGRTVIVLQDWWFADGELGECWSPSSTVEGLVVTRICMLGYRSSPNGLTEPDGKMLRPQVLGQSLSFDLAEFYSPPEQPAPGLPTFHAKTGEWITVAVRLTGDSIEWFVRDSGTDGSNGILIDDARDLPMFETGWTSIFPGEGAILVAEANGVATWRGYGLAVNEFGEHTRRPSGYFGGRTVDNTWTIIGGDPSPSRLPVWRPANWWTDNHTVIEQRAYPGCSGDVTGDSRVDGSDIREVLRLWGPHPDDLADVNHDGRVDGRDLAQVLGAWGPCP